MALLRVWWGLRTPLSARDSPRDSQAQAERSQSMRKTTRLSATGNQPPGELRAGSPDVPPRTGAPSTHSEGRLRWGQRWRKHLFFSYPGSSSLNL
ncbi:hypothetical protein D623_10006117 [Myotis brandtii]|uniref:Uncharacterized protein n=1 Tax=Myotis brandtii TaxID=109478 RepID=S7MJ97_MYOBR|nr:hypothetical protein D623_10006117 [Myotis brandtii]